MTFHLVRHAAHDNVGGFLAGRMPGVHLGEAGRAQADRLALRMKPLPLSAVYTSPRERTRETAEAIAAAQGRALTVAIEPDLDEIDFGSWSGKTFDVLNEAPEWRRWNSVRTLARTAGNETIFEVQSRAVRAVERLRRERRDETLALVTHADVIKVIVSFYLGLSLDAWPRFDIAPASISTLVLDDWSAQIVSLNTPTD